jgi:GH15 family glucan-1,4-alpha-glucosidase
VPPRIEDYALLGDTHSAALVGRDGSIDWLCLPRFDSSACFAALLGDEADGRWLLAPDERVLAVERRYRPGTLVLESDFETAAGSVRVLDFMPPSAEAPHVVRVVEGLRGSVRVRMELRPRFDYGRIRPRLLSVDGAYVAAGPDGLWLRTPVATRADGDAVRAEFRVEAGQKLPFALSWHPSRRTAPAGIDPGSALRETESFWTEWLDGCTYDGEWRDAVHRSLLTLKALTYAATGGIVAAVTTSLPELPGCVRNWDYRYCWLRDAAFTLLALTRSGFHEEARDWRGWLVRACAGDPADLQTVYGVAGERRLTELELPWLAGHAGARPVRIGNAAAWQFQRDVYGEVVNAIHHARHAGIDDDDEEVWALTGALVEFVRAHWREPDHGLWEVRGPRRQFVHSKVLAWVAVDRALADAEALGLPAPVERWRALRARIRDDVLARGFDATRRTFVQAYDSSEIDASALLFPLVGFVPATDERMRGTVAAIERELCRDGLVFRYAADGLPGCDGAFLACSFWLAANYALAGRLDDARTLFERLLALRNDLGLLAEEYDPRLGTQLGNFPQALSHVALITAANVLDDAGRGADARLAAAANRRRSGRPRTRGG